MNWYLKVLRQYADFKGRARRKEYWMFALVNIIIALILVAIIALTVNQETGEPSTIGMVAIGILVIYALATLIPGIAVSVRRLHDSDKSGWLYLISLIPFGSIVLIVLFCLDSTPGTNQYGENPKGQMQNLENNTL